MTSIIIRPEALDPRAADLLRLLRDRRQDGAECPYCKSTRMQRWGRFSGRQRYRCVGCKRTFSSLTGTPLHYTKRLHLWPRYLLALQNSETIRASARRLGVHPTTTFRWRHRFLAAVTREEQVTLSGEVEIRHYRLPVGEKGTRRLGRRRYRRGLCGVGSFHSPDRYVIVLHARDRSGGSAHHFCTGRHAPISSDFCELLDPHHAAITRLISAGRRLSPIALYSAVMGIEHVGVPPFWKAAGGGLHERGAHLFNVNAQLARYHDWIYGFRGVSWRYLEHYLAWHRFLERTQEELIGTRWIAAAVRSPTRCANTADGWERV